MMTRGKRYGRGKCYGQDRTHLSLPAKAERFYAGADPFYIYEYEYEDGGGDDTEYRYTVRAWGDPESSLMTEDELIAVLIAYADMDEEADEEADEEKA